MAEKDQLPIVLLAGGASSERAVSKSSSKGMYEALLSLGYSVRLVDPAYGSRQPDNPEAFFAEEDVFPVNAAHYIDALRSELFDGVDLVVIGLHGKYGEDGTVQALLELRGLRYTGSGVLASALSHNKSMSKIIFKDHGITVADGFKIEKKQYDAEQVSRKIRTNMAYPLVIKPNDEGSTFGLTVCESPEDLAGAIELAFRYSGTIMAEEYIAGREMTVGVLDGSVLPVLEIQPKHTLYDFECKYTKGMSEYIVPAEVSAYAAAEMQRQAKLAYEAVGCSGYARVDFRLSSDNVPYCLEINTLPGMTATSLVPKMAQAVGISFEALIEKIVRAADNGKKTT